MDTDKLITEDTDYNQLDKLYDECLNYLNTCSNEDNNNYKNINRTKELVNESKSEIELVPNTLLNNEVKQIKNEETKEIINIFKEYEHNNIEDVPQVEFKLINEMKSNETINSFQSDGHSERLRKFSQQLPRIIITQSSTSLDNSRYLRNTKKFEQCLPKTKKPLKSPVKHHPLIRKGYGDFPKRLVSKSGYENVALLSNVPFENIRMLNDAFHTMINLRWRWIVIGTVVVHFTLWLVFALFLYITALAHYDFTPDPPKKTCVTGGKDFVTIFLASVEAQTTIGFGDRAIDEECPESIFLFVMQLILGTGLSGVLTCVVYAKLTRPEKLSRDGVGFSKKAVISMRDGKLCLMIRAWDLNHDHIINSEFTMHFVHTYRTKEGETIRYYAESLTLQERQFLLWPVTLVHIIDDTSALFKYTAEQLASHSYEITVSLKGASASMGTFTQSQTSYLPKEVLWGHRFPPVVKYDSSKRKYVIDHKKLDSTEPIETPRCCAYDNYCSMKKENLCPGTPTSFSDRLSTFHLERSSSFRNNKPKSSQNSDHSSRTLSF